MVLNTRRRALGLLVGVAAALRFPNLPVAFAAEKDCFDSKAFGPWKAQATDTKAGARINAVQFTNDACELRIEVQVATSFEGKIVVYGDPDKTRLPKKFLVNPDNRLVAWGEDGKEAVNEPLCGNCTGIVDNKVSIVLPLAERRCFARTNRSTWRSGLPARRSAASARWRELRAGSPGHRSARRRAEARARKIPRPKAASSRAPVARCSASTTSASSSALSGAIATRCLRNVRGAQARSAPITRSLH
jgi:hypothetical protein